MKSYISRKFPLETMKTDLILARRSVAVMVSPSDGETGWERHARAPLPRPDWCISRGLEPEGRSQLHDARRQDRRPAGVDWLPERRAGTRLYALNRVGIQHVINIG